MCVRTFPSVISLKVVINFSFSAPCNSLTNSIAFSTIFTVACLNCPCFLDKLSKYSESFERSRDGGVKRIEVIERSTRDVEDKSEAYPHSTRRISECTGREYGKGVEVYVTSLFL